MKPASGLFLFSWFIDNNSLGHLCLEKEKERKRDFSPFQSCQIFFLIVFMRSGSTRMKRSLHFRLYGLKWRKSQLFFWIGFSDKFIFDESNKPTCDESCAILVPRSTKIQWQEIVSTPFSRKNKVSHFLSTSERNFFPDELEGVNLGSEQIPYKLKFRKTQQTKASK